MGKTVEVALTSGRTATLRELSATDQMNADRSANDLVEISYKRTAAALTKLGDRDYGPATSDLEIDSRIDQLTGREYDELREAYRLTFEPLAEAYAKDCTLRELSMREQMLADKFAGGNPFIMAYYRVAMALQQLGDQRYEPITDEVGAAARIAQLSGPQMDGAGAKYAEQFRPSRDDLKNVLSAPVSDSLPQP